MPGPQRLVGTHGASFCREVDIASADPLLDLLHAANFPFDERHKRRRTGPAVFIDLVKNPDIFAYCPRVGLSICHANLEAVGPGAQMVGHLKNKGSPGPGARIDVINPNFRCHADFPAVEEYALLEQRAGNLYGLLVCHRAREVLQPWNTPCPERQLGWRGGDFEGAVQNFRCADPEDNPAGS